MQFLYFVLFLVYFQNCHTLESTTSKEITVKGDAFMCSFNIQYEKDKCFKNSTVSCSPNQKIRRTAKNVALELNDGTKINIKKLKISRKPKKDYLIKCRIISGPTTTPALPSTTTPIPTTGCVKEDYIDYYGNDMASMVMNGLEECINWCGETTKCGYWTFAKSDKRCYLKTSDSGRTENAGTISGTKNCATGPTTTPTLPSTTTPIPTTGDSSCPYTDIVTMCAKYKDPHCTSGKWVSWMMINCAKTCKCGTTTTPALPSTTTPIPTTGASSCPYTDKVTMCAKYKDPHCTSGKWVSWMMTNCAKTCKCTGSQGCSPLPDSYDGDCSKYLWACTATKHPWFKEVCSTTCNYCDATTTTTAKPVSKCKCGVKKRATRIVGGSETEVNEYPWMAALSVKDRGDLCGGSVIADKWIVTAAHCFFHSFTGEQIFNNTNINEVMVTVGEHDKDTSSETTLTKKVAANLLIVHPKYEVLPGDANLNDIAILRVPALDLKVYTPVCLPEEHATFDGKKAWVYGWGALSAGGPYPSKLQELEVTIVSDASAKQAYHNLGRPEYKELTDAQLASMIFAGGYEGKDACQGDSGGPLTHEKNNGQHELVGATSWGDGCAQKGLPGAYAEVSAYISWFEEEIKKNGGADYSC